MRRAVGVYVVMVAGFGASVMGRLYRQAFNDYGSALWEEEVNETCVPGDCTDQDLNTFLLAAATAYYVLYNFTSGMDSYNGSGGSLDEAWSDIFALTADIVTDAKGGGYMGEASLPTGLTVTLLQVTKALICSVTLETMFCDCGMCQMDPPYPPLDGIGARYTSSAVVSHTYAMLADGERGLPLESHLDAAFNIFFHAKDKTDGGDTTFSIYANALRASCKDLSSGLSPAYDRNGEPLTITNDICAALESVIAHTGLDNDGCLRGTHLQAVQPVVFPLNSIPIQFGLVATSVTAVALQGVQCKIAPLMAGGTTVAIAHQWLHTATCPVSGIIKPNSCTSGCHASVTLNVTATDSQEFLFDVYYPRPMGKRGFYAASISNCGTECCRLTVYPNVDPKIQSLSDQAARLNATAPCNFPWMPTCLFDFYNSSNLSIDSHNIVAAKKVGNQYSCDVALTTVGVWAKFALLQDCPIVDMAPSTNCSIATHSDIDGGLINVTIVNNKCTISADLAPMPSESLPSESLPEESLDLAPIPSESLALLASFIVVLFLTLY
ncbi:hypothetical protein Pelo_6471 [Pelomyxa schiedti]|nr:hypothetical protein Pelo_6471 [Pelomyxa schiedti]